MKGSSVDNAEDNLALPWPEVTSPSAGSRPGHANMFRVHDMIASNQICPRRVFAHRRILPRQVASETPATFVLATSETYVCAVVNRRDLAGLYLGRHCHGLEDHGGDTICSASANRCERSSRSHWNKKGQLARAFPER